MSNLVVSWYASTLQSILSCGNNLYLELIYYRLSIISFTTSVFPGTKQIFTNKSAVLRERPQNERQLRVKQTKA